MTIQNPIPKFIALLLVSIVVAFITVSVDNTVLTKLNSISAAEYVELQRKLYHHSFLHHFILWVIIGGLYIASVEFITYVISRFTKKSVA